MVGLLGKDCHSPGVHSGYQHITLRYAQHCASTVADDLSIRASTRETSFREWLGTWAKTGIALASSHDIKYYILHSIVCASTPLWCEKSTERAKITILSINFLSPAGRASDPRLAQTSFWVRSPVLSFLAPPSGLRRMSTERVEKNR